MIRHPVFVVFSPQHRSHGPRCSSEPYWGVYLLLSSASLRNSGVNVASSLQSTWANCFTMGIQDYPIKCGLCLAQMSNLTAEFVSRHTTQRICKRQQFAYSPWGCFLGSPSPLSPLSMLSMLLPSSAAAAWAWAWLCTSMRAIRIRR